MKGCCLRVVGLSVSPGTEGGNKVALQEKDQVHNCFALQGYLTKGMVEYKLMLSYLSMNK